jgi:uncharacterized protein
MAGHRKGEMMYVTKYLNSFDLDDRHVLLVNGLSGAVDIVERDDFQLLDDPDALATRSDKSDLVDQLRRRAYLFDDVQGEQQAFGAIQTVYQRLLDSQSYKFTFVFNPTYMCNFACPYCFESEEMHTTRKVMTPEQVDLCWDAMHQIMEMRGKGKINTFKGKKGLELFGGEPFLPVARPALKRLFARAEEEGFKIEAITNGYALHRSKDLIERYRELFDHFQITLDGPRDIHDSRRKLLGGGRTFDRIVKNIDMLMDLDITVAVRMNTDGQNIDNLPEMIRFFAEKEWLDSGKFYWDIAPVTDHPNSGDVPHIMSEHQIVQKVRTMFGDLKHSPTNFRMFRVLKHVLRAFEIYRDDNEEPFPSGHYCEANVFQFYCFGPDGLIYACPESIDHPDLAVGGFDPEFWIDHEKLQTWGRTIFNSPQCKDCSVAMFCGGGCAFASKLSHPDTGLPVCDDAPQVLAAYIDSIKDYILDQHCN